MGLRDHRKLEIFQNADAVAVDVYRTTKRFPKSEEFGLTSQMRRSAVSVSTNIVEGCGRKSSREFQRYLDIAFGSARELGYLIDLSHRLGYIDSAEAQELAETHRRSTSALASFISKRKDF